MSRALSTLVLAVLICGAVPVYADTITVSGAITQSTADGTGPAANNTSLNSINDSDSYSVSLNFVGSISTPGTYNQASKLTGATLVFSDPTAPSTETAFDNANSTLKITQSAGVDTFNWLGCLTTGVFGCTGGNQLDLIFTIPAAGLNSQNVPAGAVFGQKPFELLEDDGVTDIQGTVTTYSYTPTASAAPEPGTFTLLASGLASLAALRRRFRSCKRTHDS